MTIVFIISVVWLVVTSYFLFFRKKESEKGIVENRITTTTIKGAISPSVNLIIEKDYVVTETIKADITIKLADLLQQKRESKAMPHVKVLEESSVEVIIKGEEEEIPDFEFPPTLELLDYEEEKEEYNPNFLNNVL